MPKSDGATLLKRYRVRTALGDFLAGFRGGKLAALALPGTWQSAKPVPVLGGQEGAAGRRLVRELRQYLAGRLKRFSVPMAPGGSEWQRRVWAALSRIPWGQVRTYGELACMAGAPGAARAVGAACGANPIIILPPCHRAVAADGLGGFGGRARRLGWKRKLLEIEGRSAL